MSFSYMSPTSSGPLTPHFLLTSQVAFHSVTAGTMLPLMLIIFTLYRILSPLLFSPFYKLLDSPVRSLALTMQIQSPWSLMLHVPFTCHSWIFKIYLCDSLTDNCFTNLVIIFKREGQSPFPSHLHSV